MMRSSVLPCFGAHAGGHHLAELQALGALRDALDVVRVVVLSVDEDDLLRAAGDVELAALQHSEIAGAQPAVGGVKPFGVRVRILVVALRDVVAAR